MIKIWKSPKPTEILEFPDLLTYAVEHYNRISTDFFAYYRTKEKSIWAALVFGASLVISLRILDLDKYLPLAFRYFVLVFYSVLYFFIFHFMKKEQLKKIDAKNIVMCSRLIAAELSKLNPNNTDTIKAFLNYSKDKGIPDALFEKTDSLQKKLGRGDKVLLVALVMFYIFSIYGIMNQPLLEFLCDEQPNPTAEKSTGTASLCFKAEGD